MRYKVIFEKYIFILISLHEYKYINICSNSNYYFYVIFNRPDLKPVEIEPEVTLRLPECEPVNAVLLRFDEVILFMLTFTYGLKNFFLTHRAYVIDVHYHLDLTLKVLLLTGINFLV